MTANLYRLFAHHFADHPDGVFLDVPGAAPLTYGALDDLTASASLVLADMGVRPGERVVAVAHKTPATVVLYLACLRHGAVFVPIDPSYPSALVEDRVADADPALVVTSDLGGGPALGSRPRLTLDATGAGTLTERIADTRGPSSAPVATVDGSAPAALLYTSGTTGRPKGAVLSHENLATNARALHHAWRFEPDDVLLHVLPVFHAHGLFVALHTSLLNASPILFPARFDVSEAIDLLSRATVFMGVPTHYTRLLDHPRLDAAATANVRLFVSGSAPLLPSTWAEFRERTGHEILERYGMTETGMIASNPYEGPRVAGTVGFPLAGVETRVVDGDRVLGPDEVGVLEVRGPNVSAGYWGRHESSGARRGGGWFHTGDLARVDHDGRISLVGRASDLVITGGLNVRPVEVERVLDAMPGVAESVVVGLPHPDLGEAVAAIVVADGDGLDVDALLSRAAEALPRYKLPKAVRPVEALPRNAMGKVDRPALRERFADLFRGDPPVAPR